MIERPKVAIIGAGTLGIGALKNFLEEGFQATAFERNDYVAGIWHFNEDEKLTSCTDQTQWNSCSQMACFTDFPFPPGTPDYPNRPIVQAYIESYCEHFSLNKHIRSSTDVLSVVPIEGNTKWELTSKDKTGMKSMEIFDRIIVAVGQNCIPLWPKNVGGWEHFKGRVLHSQAFKRGSDFDGKRVLILGSSNTAMDTAVELNGHAEKIYVSHRNGGILIPRWDKFGLPVEFTLSLRLQAFGRLLEHISPKAWAKLFNKTCMKLSTDRFGELPNEWRLNRPHKGQMANPIVNDKIADLLLEKKVSIVHGVRQITTSGGIELSNGDVITDVDTIILCTGYAYDFSVVPQSVNPARHTNSQWDASERTNGRPLYRLYQGFISLDCPDSLAFLGVSGYPSSQMPLFDLVTMALAQLWKGAVKFPPQAEMEAEVNKRHKFLLSLTKSEGPQIFPHRMDVGVWMNWLHDVAGTGMNERFSYSFKSWLNWIIHRRYISDLMTGVNSPHLWRLFDGRRKKWDGAQEAINKSNEERERRMKAAVAGKKAKKDA